MNIYNSNLIHLCDKKGVTITEFENIIYIPKVRIIDPQPEEIIRIAEYFNISIDVLLLKDLKAAADLDTSKIKLIILDIDGTMTDGGMYFTENGDRFKKYNAKDGMAIIQSIKKGMKFGIISHSHISKMVEDRAELLGIQHVYVGKEDKTQVLNNWCTELGLTLDEIAFIGDDINDLEVMKQVGLSACPNDAVKEIQKISNIILSRKGGDACIREFMDDWF